MTVSHILLTKYVIRYNKLTNISLFDKLTALEMECFVVIVLLNAVCSCRSRVVKVVLYAIQKNYLHFFLDWDRFTEDTRKYVFLFLLGAEKSNIYNIDI